MFGVITDRALENSKLPVRFLGWHYPQITTFAFRKRKKAALPA